MKQVQRTSVKEVVKNRLEHAFMWMLILTVISTNSCASLPKVDSSFTPTLTDYSQLSNWAAHPMLKDKADLVPNNPNASAQDDLLADVFFVHPTTYTTKSINDAWNAPVNNEKLNKLTDASTIQYQASIFNKAGRIFVPRYRQAHIQAYFLKDEKRAEKIFNIAYEDVKDSFEYYLKEYNKGRPFIIASHSQGTTHTARLIKELIDGTELRSQLVAAYLIGMPILKQAFTNIGPCKDKDETMCFVSWRTYKAAYIPEDAILGDSIAVHNPLSWQMDDSFVDKSENTGAILRNFNKIIDNAATAQVNNGILWASKPKFAFSFLFTRKNYHIADLNFYYFNVQENAIHRVLKYLELEN